MGHALAALFPPPDGKKRIVWAAGSPSPALLAEALAAADPGMLLHAGDAAMQAWADAAGVQALSMPAGALSPARHAAGVARVAALLPAVLVAFPGADDAVARARAAKLDVEAKPRVHRR